MKLRSITLVNVRRFAGITARLDGLGDGLTVFGAPNEAGKSTFFDALQALFFLPARSGAADARSLRPYAGGAPEVEAEVELDGARFRLAKRWLSRPMARVSELPSGRVLAQDDAAERWIRDRITGAGAGPAELLWVRQGMLALEPADRPEQDRLLAIRRDLLSSVAAELEAITGGRRMDAIAARCETELGEIATATGKPKANGPWKTAEQEAAELRAELGRLESQCAELASALDERAAVNAELAEATDPFAAAARTSAVASAERAAEAARAHATRLAAAESAARTAALELDTAARDLATHDRTTGRHARAETATAEARGMQQSAAAALEAAEQNATAAAADAAAAQEALAAADRTARANAAADLMAAQNARLDRATALAAAAAAARAEAEAVAVTDGTISAARAADARLDRARARAEAGAVTVAIDYLPGVRDRITLDGRPLEPGAPVACAGPAVLDLPGLGRLTLAPGRDAAEAARDAEAAAAELGACLAPSGAADLAALVALADRRREAHARAVTAEAELSGLVPDGIPALQAEIAGLRTEAAGAEPGAPDPQAASAALEAATTAKAGANATLAAAAPAVQTARDRLDAAGRELAEAAAEAGALPPRADLAARQTDRDQAAAAAERLAAELRRAAPDATAAEAAEAAAKDQALAAERRIQRLETRAAELGAQIRGRAEEGVEERRNETAGRLEEADARAAGYAAEARALTRLREALATARTDARERYLAPVTAELAPLLGLVLDGAEMRMHPTRLLPERLVRDGVEEQIADLSGGTREQIAILTRLAFARLLARSGRATPVILDDALVFADDARTERMCAAINRVAAEVQVIVLTCRERMSTALAGATPTLSLSDREDGIERRGSG